MVNTTLWPAGHCKYAMNKAHRLLQQIDKLVVSHVAKMFCILQPF